MRGAAAIALLLMGAAGCGAPAPPPPAGPLGLHAALSAMRLPLGARARLEVRMRRDPGVEAPFPPVAALLGAVEGLAAVEEQARQRTLPDGAVLEERLYALRLFKAGRCELPRLEVEGRRGEERLRAQAPELALEALPALEDRGPEVEAPEEPLDLGGSSRLPWIAAGAGAALLAALLFALRRRRRSAPAGAPPLAPHLAALAALEELRGWPRAGAQAVDALVVGCSGIVRTYIEAAFGLQAPDRTTEEFLAQAAADRPFGEQPLRLLAGFLAECDRAKFAAWTPPAERLEALLAAAASFIRSTAPAGDEP